MTRDMPNISAPHLDTPDSQKLEPRTVSVHAPRILLLAQADVVQSAPHVRSGTHPSTLRCGD